MESSPPGKITIETSQNYRWYILLLVVLTGMFVIAMPLMGVSVLAQEIAADLNLFLLGVLCSLGVLGVSSSRRGNGRAGMF